MKCAHYSHLNCKNIHLLFSLNKAFRDLWIFCTTYRQRMFITSVITKISFFQLKARGGVCLGLGEIIHITHNGTHFLINMYYK